MTPEQIFIAQDSFQKVAAIAEQAAEIFYRTLFDLDPRLKSLFHSDMQEQGRKLMHIIGVAVHGLKNPQALIPAVQDLGRRHVRYGVEAKDYETVGKALMLTLEQGLGPDFPLQVREAWSATYALFHNRGDHVRQKGAGSPSLPPHHAFDVQFRADHESAHNPAQDNTPVMPPRLLSLHIRVPHRNP